VTAPLAGDRPVPFLLMIEDDLEVTFKTTVLGVTVTVQKVTQTESGIVADCVRGGHHQAISVLDLCPSRRREARSGSPPTGAGRVGRRLGLDLRTELWQRCVAREGMPGTRGRQGPGGLARRCAVSKA
jgi:hypothetical protein